MGSNGTTLYVADRGQTSCKIALPVSRRALASLHEKN